MPSFSRQVMLLAMLLGGAASATTCYYPDGTSEPGTSQFACNPDAEFSACCDAGDMCTTNGFCKDLDNDKANNFYWRDGCTDSTWNSPNCASYCDNERTDVNASSQNRRVLACSQTTYCCAYANDTSCCNDDTRTFDAGIAAYLAGPKAQTSMFTATMMSTSTSAPSATISPSAAADSDDGGLSTGAKAGIGIGAALGAIAVFGVLGFVFWRRHKRAGSYDAVSQQGGISGGAGPYMEEQQKDPVLPSYQDQTGDVADYKYQQHYHQDQNPVGMVEADGQPRGPAEMPANNETRGELPG